MAAELLGIYGFREACECGNARGGDAGKREPPSRFSSLAEVMCVLLRDLGPNLGFLGALREGGREGGRRDSMPAVASRLCPGHRGTGSWSGWHRLQLWVLRGMGNNSLGGQEGSAP